MRLVLVVTHRCNLQCAYCRKTHGSELDMPYETAVKAIQFACRTKPRTLQLGFYGGEPLLQLLLIQKTVRAAKTYHPASQIINLMTTNGSLLTPDICDWLRSERFHLSISIDGTASAHNVLRTFPGGASSYERCLNGLRMAVAHKLSPQVLMVVDPRTIAELADGVSTLYGLENIRRIALLCNNDAQWDAAALAQLQEQYEAIGDIVLASYRSRTPLSVNMITNKLHSHIQGGYSKCSHCRFGGHELFVDPSGRLYPCERFLGNDPFCMGDLQQGLLVPRMEQLNAELAQPRSECVSCPFSDRCVHWCGCRNYARTGTLAGFDPFICAYEKICIRVADRVGDTLFKEQNKLFLIEFYGKPWLSRFKRTLRTLFHFQKPVEDESEDRSYWR